MAILVVLDGQSSKNHKAAYGGKEEVMEPGDILLVQIAVLIIILVGSGLVFALMSKRYIHGVQEKTFAYLCAECSYAPGRSQRLLDRVKKEAPGRFRVPILITLAGILTPLLYKLFNIVKGLYVLLIFALILFLVVMLLRHNQALEIFTIGPTKELHSWMGDLFSLCVFLILLVVFLAYHFRVVSSDLYELENNAREATSLLKKAGWCNVAIDTLDTVSNQVKIDLDLYKSNVGLGGLVLMLLTTFVTFIGKEAKAITPDVASVLLAVTGTVTVCRWMYESYRTHILHIAANALLEIKKHKLTLAAQEAHKVTEVGGRNSVDPASLWGVSGSKTYNL